MAEDVGTGVDTLDEMLNGGFREGDVVLISGGPGTGKTVLSTQFIWNGVQNGDQCVLITTEQLPEELIQDVKGFGYDLDTVEDDALTVKYLDPTQDVKYLTEEIMKLLEGDVDRIAIDSLSFLESRTGENRIRQQLSQLIQDLRTSDVTAVITAEVVGQEANKYSRNGVVEFLTDGIIYLTGLSLGDMQYRSLQIIKMRGKDFAEQTARLSFGDNGIELTLEDTIA